MVSRTVKVDAVRRAKIGAEKRTRTRAQLLEAAAEVFGHEGGRATRIEDVCEAAAIARGTFYRYFPSIEALQTAIFEHLSSRFDLAVHAAFEELDGPGERTSAAIRYYLNHVVEDQKWGWGMVNTSMGIGLIPAPLPDRVKETIQEGIEAGVFDIGTAQAGRDILLGSGLAAAVTLLSQEAPAEYITSVATGVLQALGCPADQARRLARVPIPELHIR